MLQPIADAIAGPTATSYAWSHSRQDIVDAVEGVFSAIKDREDKEKSSWRTSGKRSRCWRKSPAARSKRRS